MAVDCVLEADPQNWTVTMSRILSVFFICFSLFSVAGCAFDKEGRGEFARSKGSLKDTHLSSHKTAKVSKKRQHVKIAHKPKKVKTKRLVHTSHAKHKKSVDDVIKIKPSPQPKQLAEKDSENEVVKVITDKPFSHSKETIKDQQNLLARQVSQSQSAELKQDILKELQPVTTEKSSPLEDFVKRPQVAAKSDVQEDIPATNKTRAFQTDLVGENTSPYSIVRVYYATDRNLSGSLKPKKVYGTRRSSITYGYSDVSIPRSHKVGMLEAPTLWRMEFREDPKRHVVLKNVKRQSKTRFFQEIRKNIRISKGKNAFVFVHGYNIEFHEAALRTAQIAHDLNFDGAPIFYSWPSNGTLKGYLSDQTNVRWTQSNLKRFIRDFANRSDAENIYLIAHSMGSRALTGAVAELVTEIPTFKKRFKEIMLAAPDIDAEVFKRDIAPKLVQASKNVTLYASADDKALLVSRSVHGGPRAGDAGENLVIVDGIDTIDATGVDTSFFAHSYFAQVPRILSDIFSIIHHGRRPHTRNGLVSAVASHGQYWVFRKNKPIIVNGTTTAIHDPSYDVAH